MSHRRPFACLLVLLLLLLGGGGPGGAQALPEGRGSFRLFSTEDGIPQLAVYALAPDAGGSLWAGTMAGLARWDGLRWRPVETPASRYSTYVNSNALSVFSDGSLWVGTRSQGILVHRNGQWRTVDPGSGFPSLNVNAVLEGEEKDAQGNRVVWAATYGHGLCRRVQGRWEVLGRKDGLGDERLFCLLQTREVPGAEPQLWIGSTQGIWIHEQGRIRPFEGNTSLPDKRVRCLAETRDADGTRCIWMGLEEGGLVLWRRGRCEIISFKAQGGSDMVRHLVREPRPGGDVLWAATIGGGVGRLEGGRWTWLRTAQGMPGNTARCLALTPGGPEGQVLWVGMDGQGIARYPGKGWLGVPLPPGLQDRRVQCFWETGNALWAGSPTEGLLRLQDGRWTRYRPGTQLPLDSVRAIYAFPGEPDLYLASFQGLCIFREGRSRLLTPREGLPAAQIRALEGTQDAQGRRLLWLGTSRSLHVWDGRSFRGIEPPPGDPECSVRALAADGEALWVGTERALHRYEGGRWSDPLGERLQGLSVSRLLLQKDAQGRRRLWIATFGSGLFLVPDLDRPDTLISLHTQSTPPLPHNLVDCLAEDGQGRVWAAGPRGPVRVDARGPRPVLDTFTQADGLPMQESVGGGLFTDRDGRVWLGTQGGLAMLPPGAGEVRREPRRLDLLQAEAQGRPLERGAQLPSGSQDILFQVCLHSGHREEDNRYRTQLVGLQGQPGPWTAETLVRFPSLPSGRYTLRVWARDWTGTESGPIEFTFRVLPPLWLRWWALASYLVLLGAGVQGLLRLRTRFLASRNALLTERVDKATQEVLEQSRALEELNRELLQLNLQKNEFIGIAAHDLKNPLNTIMLVSGGLLSGDLEDCPEHLRPWLTRIDQSARRMTDLITEFLDLNAIDSGRTHPKLRQLDIGEVLPGLLESYQERLQAKRQRLEVDGPLQGLPVHADPMHLRQVLDNLVSNAVKYSPLGSAIRLQVLQKDDQVTFKVKDQGPGISPEDMPRLFRRFARLSARPTGGESSSGLGLSIVKLLVQGMGGEVWAESEPGQGAIFAIRLPASAGAWERGQAGGAGAAGEGRPAPEA